MSGDRAASPGPPLRQILRRAQPDEAGLLRALARRSKAHWPYTAEFLAAVEPLLQLSEKDVREQPVYVLELDDAVAGWHRVTVHDNRAELEDLWLEPEWIGHGHGRTLFVHAVAIARAHGARRLEWDAEPYALGFYEAMGGTVIGEVPSAAVPGRMLPRMGLSL